MQAIQCDVVYARLVFGDERSATGCESGLLLAPTSAQSLCAQVACMDSVHTLPSRPEHLEPDAQPGLVVPVSFAMRHSQQQQHERGTLTLARTTRTHARI